MNGALIEQGILNIEIEPETALKVFGKRDKSKREKKESPLQNSPQNMTRKIKCFPKIEKKEEKQEEEPKENRLVTNLIQWTHKQRKLLIKIATEYGLIIENPNEKREHQSTEDYILSKSDNLKSDVYSMAEKLVVGLEEIKTEKTGLIEWEDDLEGREETLAQNQKQLETDKQEHAENVQKDKEAQELRDKVSRIKEREAREGLEQLEEEKQNQEYARVRASAHIHKGFDFLRKMKKIFEAKEEQANQKLDDALKIAQRAENLQNSLTSPYYNFADDIKFEDARLMAAKGDGQGLCYWFNCLGHKFGSWLHKAEYFVKTFWKKTPDEIINVGEDMKKNCCKNLGEYIEKGMKAKTINQIKETREIKEEIPQVRKKVRSRDDGWEW